MTAESSEPEEVGPEKPDESVVLNLDDLAAELEDVEVDEAKAAEAGRKLAETLHRVTSPPWLESTQRLNKLPEGAVRPQMLESTQRIRDIVAGPQSPAMSVVKSITESMALREDLIKPRFMLSDAIAKSTAERAAFSVASGLKISDSVGSVALSDRKAALSPADAGQMASASSSKAVSSRWWAGSSVAMS
ncbi:MAG: hypothetical protein H0U36_03590 [Nocardioidaceae bacterium]|nr:hypothetical protein [Nocardioidaceae bacterium]